MDQNDAIVAVLSMAIGAATLLTLVRLWLNGRKNVAAATVASFENRLARVEVALDDVTAELSRMTDAQQLLTKTLVDRQPQALP
ncbi:MAG TPA: hypothetical protein VNV25_18730 [Gemmatimonadaceae bacterium]|nr:hypothetical protein [Gemmatimonadaceae bacterium]